MNRGDRLAYPCAVPVAQNGMTIREAMAMHIAAGLCANPDSSYHDVDANSERAIKQTDALLKALERPANE